MFKKIKEVIFGKKVVGLWLRVGTDKGVIMKVSEVNFESSEKGNFATIFINDFVVNKKSRPLIESLKKKNFIWNEVPRHFKKRLRDENYASVNWNQIEGYLI